MFTVRFKDSHRCPSVLECRGNEQYLAWLLHIRHDDRQYGCKTKQNLLRSVCSQGDGRENRKITRPHYLREIEVQQVSKDKRKGPLALLGGSQGRLPRGRETRAESRKMEDVGLAV